MMLVSTSPLHLVVACICTKVGLWVLVKNPILHIWPVVIAVGLFPVTLVELQFVEQDNISSKRVVSLAAALKCRYID